MTTPANQELAERWTQLEALEENWDSYRAKPIDPAILAEGKTLATELSERSPWPTPHSDGSIALYLDGRGDERSIEIATDGSYIIYLERLSREQALAILRTLKEQSNG